MNQYEFVFVTAEEDKKLLNEVEELISGFEGKVGKKEDWGKRQFAYRLKKLTEGHYHVWNLQLDRVKLAEFKNKLNLEERIIRYLILKQD